MSESNAAKPLAGHYKKAGVEAGRGAWEFRVDSIDDLELGSEIECTPDDLSNCFPGQQCDAAGRCVQCISDGDCGVGTTCNEATGACISDNVCTSDSKTTMRTINTSTFLVRSFTIRHYYN